MCSAYPPFILNDRQNIIRILVLSTVYKSLQHVTSDVVQPNGRKFSKHFGNKLIAPFCIYKHHPVYQNFSKGASLPFLLDPSPISHNKLASLPEYFLLCMDPYVVVGKPEASTLGADGGGGVGGGPWPIYCRVKYPVAHKS